MKLLAIIPARGGSVRIPGKNIVPLLGRPLISWTIAAALSAQIPMRLHISTDDDAISACAADAGAPVPFLRDDLADGATPLVDVILYEMARCAAHYGEKYDAVMLLQATSPLRTAAHINAAVTQFQRSNAPSLVSVHPFHGANPWWAMTLMADSSFAFVNPERVKQRSQDLPPAYCPNGAIFIAKTDVLRREKSFYVAGAKAFVLPWYAGFDIDEPEDLAVAAMLAKHYAG